MKREVFVSFKEFEQAIFAQYQRLKGYLETLVV